MTLDRTCNKCLLSILANEKHDHPRRITLNEIRQEKTTVYLYDGIMLSLQKGVLHSPRIVNCYDEDPGSLWLMYQIGGGTSINIDGQEFNMKPGYMVIVNGTSMSRKLHSSPGRSFGCVHIRLNQAFLQKYLHQKTAHTSQSLNGLLKNSLSNQFLPSKQLSPGIQLALQQLFNSPFDAPLELLFVESRMLDIVCDSLSLVIGDTTDECNIALSRQDVEKIHQAREMLMEDLTAPPPSIKELAKQVGINEFKLKKGFRFLFKTSIYTYHRNARMDLARTLLSEGLHNVCEVACAVGYSNPSHFCRAFHNLFNINPGAYLRDIRNKGFHINAATSQVAVRQ